MSKRISGAFAVTENNVYLTLFERGSTKLVEGVNSLKKEVKLLPLVPLVSFTAEKNNA